MPPRAIPPKEHAVGEAFFYLDSSYRLKLAGGQEIPLSEWQPASVCYVASWGCGKGAQLYFHWKTILLPKHIAEYVVVHEMTHLLDPHHTPEFWLRLERAMPDYAQRKSWLAEHGIEVEGV